MHGIDRTRMMFSGKKFRLWSRRSSSKTDVEKKPLKEIKLSDGLHEDDEKIQKHRLSGVGSANHDRCTAQLQRLRDDYHRLEMTVENLVPYKSKACALEEKLLLVTGSFERKQSRYSATLSSLEIENERLREQMERLRASCSNCYFCSRNKLTAAAAAHINMLHKNSFRYWRREDGSKDPRKRSERADENMPVAVMVSSGLAAEQQQDNSKCLNEISSELIQALRSQEGLRRDCVQLQDRIQRLEKQNGQLNDIIFRQQYTPSPQANDSAIQGNDAFTCRPKVLLKEAQETPSSQSFASSESLQNVSDVKQSQRLFRDHAGPLLPDVSTSSQEDSTSDDHIPDTNASPTSDSAQNSDSQSTSAQQLCCPNDTTLFESVQVLQATATDGVAKILASVKNKHSSCGNCVSSASSSDTVNPWLTTDGQNYFLASAPEKHNLNRASTFSLNDVLDEGIEGLTPSGQSDESSQSDGTAENKECMESATMNSNSCAAGGDTAEHDSDSQQENCEQASDKSASLSDDNHGTCFTQATTQEMQIPTAISETEANVHHNSSTKNFKTNDEGSGSEESDLSSYSDSDNGGLISEKAFLYDIGLREKSDETSTSKVVMSAKQRINTFQTTHFDTISDETDEDSEEFGTMKNTDTIIRSKTDKSQGGFNVSKSLDDYYSDVSQTSSPDGLNANSKSQDNTRADTSQDCVIVNTFSQDSGSINAEQKIQSIKGRFDVAPYGISSKEPTTDVTISKDKVTALTAYFEEVHAEQCPDCQHGRRKCHLSNARRSSSDSKDGASFEEDLPRTEDIAQQRHEQPDGQAATCQANSSPKLLRRPMSELLPQQTSPAFKDQESSETVKHETHQILIASLAENVPDSLENVVRSNGNVDLRPLSNDSSCCRDHPDKTSRLNAMSSASSGTLTKQTQWRSLPTMSQSITPRPFQINYVRAHSLRTFSDVLTPPASPKTHQQHEKSKSQDNVRHHSQNQLRSTRPEHIQSDSQGHVQQQVSESQMTQSPAVQGHRHLVRSNLFSTEPGQFLVPTNETPPMLSSQLDSSDLLHQEPTHSFVTTDQFDTEPDHQSVSADQLPPESSRNLIPADQSHQELPCRSIRAYDPPNDCLHEITQSRYSELVNSRHRESSTPRPQMDEKELNKSPVRLHYRHVKPKALTEEDIRKYRLDSPNEAKRTSSEKGRVKSVLISDPKEDSVTDTDTTDEFGSPDIRTLSSKPPRPPRRLQFAKCFIREEPNTDNDLESSNEFLGFSSNDRYAENFPAKTGGTLDVDCLEQTHRFYNIPSVEEANLSQSPAVASMLKGGKKTAQIPELYDNVRPLEGCGSPPQPEMDRGHNNPGRHFLMSEMYGISDLEVPNLVHPKTAATHPFPEKKVPMLELYDNLEMGKLKPSEPSRRRQSEGKIAQTPETYDNIGHLRERSPSYTEADTRRLEGRDKNRFVSETYDNIIHLEGFKPDHPQISTRPEMNRKTLKESTNEQWHSTGDTDQKWEVRKRNSYPDSSAKVITEPDQMWDKVEKVPKLTWHHSEKWNRNARPVGSFWNSPAYLQKTMSPNESSYCQLQNTGHCLAATAKSNDLQRNVGGALHVCFLGKDMTKNPVQTCDLKVRDTTPNFYEKKLLSVANCDSRQTLSGFDAHGRAKYEWKIPIRRFPASIDIEIPHTPAGTSHLKDTEDERTFNEISKQIESFKQTVSNLQKKTD